MANVFAIHSVGHSIVTFLRNTYPQTTDGEDMPACSFELMSSGELAAPLDDSTRLTLYLYAVTHSEHAHAPSRPTAAQSPVLGLELHYLLSAWGAKARDEQVPLAWAMRQLHQYPVLDVSSLSPQALWSSSEVIQIVPAELSTENMMRVWDALAPSYRLSVSYTARLVRIDSDPRAPGRPVVASRFGYSDVQALEGAP